MKNLCLFFIVSFLSIGILAQPQPDYDPSKDQEAPVMEKDNLVNLSNSGVRPKGEWRALWVDAWNKGVFNAAEIKKVVTDAEQYGYNAIVLQVRRRGDAIYFPSQPNSEPRMKGLASDFDALEEMIRQAHPKGIEVHAWITTFLVAPSRIPTSPEHVYHRHPEYLTRNLAGETKIVEGYYLDPGNPNALAWNERVVLDLVTNYDIDGFHFDYVRLPQQDSGYNSVAIRRYQEEFQLTEIPAPNDPQFSDWRRRQITDWLRYMYTQINTIKPAIKVTAATFASRGDAYHNRFQDWARWMKEGIIDANMSMNYSTSDDIYEKRVQDILEHSYQRHSYMGVGSYLMNIGQTTQQLKFARDKGVHGMILFSYAYNYKEGQSQWGFEHIQKEVFSSPTAVPEMPWKTRPTAGHIYGQVLDASGVGLYNQRVSVEGTEQSVLTDSQGRYAILWIPEGDYRVVVNNTTAEVQIRPGQSEKILFHLKQELHR